MLSLFPCLAFVLSFASTVARAASDGHSKNSSSWPGWNGIRYWFAFGDSYSTIGFNSTKTQPAPNNPLGNPPWPGLTSSNGPNYVGFLTTKYNASLIQTVDLAYWGATLDASLIAAYTPTVTSVEDQITNEFLPLYTTPTRGWHSEDTLFSIFIGINDVANSYRIKKKRAFDPVFDKYAALVEQLYTAGARNFLFMAVPPVQYSPTTQALGDDSDNVEENSIEDWNKRLTQLAKNTEDKHPGIAVFKFDTYTLFRKVLKHPTDYPQTAGYKNTTGFCPYYQNGTPRMDTVIPSCAYPVNQYLWLNGLHVTYPMHDLLAEQLAADFNSTPPGTKPANGAAPSILPSTSSQTKLLIALTVTSLCFTLLL